MMPENSTIPFDQSVQLMTGMANEFAASIQYGNREKAISFLEYFLKVKPKLDIKVIPPVNDDQDTFSVQIHVEDRLSSWQEFTMKLRLSDTILDLKRKFLIEWNIPLEAQRWIIGRRIWEDWQTLHRCGLKSDGLELYLYIVKAHSVGLTREVFEANKSAYVEGRLPVPLTPQYSSSADGNLQGNSYLTYTGNPSSPGLNSSFSDNHLPQVTEKNTVLMTPTWKNQEPGDASLMDTSKSTNSLNNTLPTVPVLLQSLESGIASQDSLSNNTPPESSTTVLMPCMPVTLQPPEEPEKVGWNCPSCTFLNVPTRPGCKMCSTSRPESYMIPPDYVMTEEELLRLAVDQEMERKTREEEADLLQTNYADWMEADMLDLIENKESFECPICFDEIEPRNGIVLRECLHTFCRECLHNAVQHCEDAVLSCPYQDDLYSCDAILQEREIRALVSENLYSKYLQRSLDEAESKAQNSYHCKTTDCHGWCMYEDDVNFFTCPVCNKKNCLTCKAIHEGMDCQQFQTSLEDKLETDANAKKTKMLLDGLLDSGDAMRCPQCRIILQKKDGCDWLKCSICKLEICWVTKGPRWGPAGNGDTSGGCGCRVGGRKCHNACVNCH